MPFVAAGALSASALPPSGRPPGALIQGPPVPWHCPDQAGERQPDSTHCLRSCWGLQDSSQQSGTRTLPSSPTSAGADPAPDEGAPAANSNPRADEGLEAAPASNPVAAGMPWPRCSRRPCPQQRACWGGQSPLLRVTPRGAGVLPTAAPSTVGCHCRR
eukprot:14876047-Alexandrium_andersonii.AAC.1